MSDLNPYEEGLAVDLSKAKAVIKALTEQLEAARADAKEAEAYAEELEDYLSKAVEALRFYADENRYGLPSDGPWGLGSTDFGKIARATLAEMGDATDE